MIFINKEIPGKAFLFGVVINGRSLCALANILSTELQKFLIKPNEPTLISYEAKRKIA